MRRLLISLVLVSFFLLGATDYYIGPFFHPPTSLGTLGQVPVAQPTSATTGQPQAMLWGGITVAGTNTTITGTCSGGSTGVAIAAGSTNNRGSITTSSSASTNCTITWSSVTPFGTLPFCLFTDANASITPLAYSVDNANCNTTSCKFDFASATSAKVNWICL